MRWTKYHPIKVEWCLTQLAISSVARRTAFGEVSDRVLARIPCILEGADRWIVLLLDQGADDYSPLFHQKGFAGANHLFGQA